MKAWILFVTALFLPGWLFAELPVGSTPASVVLSGDDGGYVDGRGDFDSTTLTGKVSIIFYVDPDERDLNEKVSEALGDDKIIDEASDAGKFASYAIINMAATWLPNMVLEGLIEDSQKEFPDTNYVFDMDEILHKKWNIATDSNDIIVLDMEGNVAFSKDGKLSDADIQSMLKAIHDSL